VPEAIMYKGILVEAGVECILEPGNSALAAYAYSLSDGVRLLVHEAQEERARKVLEDAGYKG